MSNIWGIAGAHNPTGTSNCTRYREVSIAGSRVCFGIPNKGSWLSWSNNAHGMQHIRRESGRWSQWFNHCMDEIEYKPSWRIFRELGSWSVWDVYRRNTAMLSSQDPRLIAEILSNPRSIPYRSSDSVPTILRYSDTTLTKTLNSKYPPNPPTHLLSLSKLWMTSENPDHISVFICLHRSVLVLLNSEFIFMSSSQFSPFRFRYIKPFQYSHSLVLASALPSYISASLLLNSLNSVTFASSNIESSTA